MTVSDKCISKLIFFFTGAGVDLVALEVELQAQTNALPRAETTRKALAHSYVVTVADRAAAIAFSNRYAPEHLIVNVEDAESWLDELGARLP